MNYRKLIESKIETSENMNKKDFDFLTEDDIELIIDDIENRVLDVLDDLSDIKKLPNAIDKLQMLANDLNGDFI